MNVASLELCKELYEVSGWGHLELPFGWWETIKNGWELVNLDEGYEIPAYDLGYLLRRLSEVGRWVLQADKLPQVCIGMLDGTGWTRYEFADTPENATAKLAIELFKQNILTKQA